MFRLNEMCLWDKRQICAQRYCVSEHESLLIVWVPVCLHIRLCHWSHSGPNTQHHTSWMETFCLIQPKLRAPISFHCTGLQHAVKWLWSKFRLMVRIRHILVQIKGKDHQEKVNTSKLMINLTQDPLTSFSSLFQLYLTFQLLLTFYSIDRLTAFTASKLTLQLLTLQSINLHLVSTLFLSLCEKWRCLVTPFYFENSGVVF